MAPVTLINTEKQDLASNENTTLPIEILFEGFCRPGFELVCIESNDVIVQ